MLKLNNSFCTLQSPQSSFFKAVAAEKINEDVKRSFFHFNSIILVFLLKSFKAGVMPRLRLDFREDIKKSGEMVETKLFFTDDRRLEMN